MGISVSAHSWKNTTLGPPTDWPQSLKAIVSLCLNSPLPGVVRWGTDGLTFYNDAFIPLLGDFHSDPPAIFSDAIWSKSWASVLNIHLHAAATGEGSTHKNVEISVIRNRQLVQSYWDFIVSPIRGDAGELAGAFGQAIEITERVLADRIAHDSAEKLRQALAAGDGVGTWDWDVRANRVQSDPRFARLYGVPIEKAQQGAPIEEFFARIHQDDAPYVQKSIIEAMRTGEVFAEEYRLVADDGSVRWVLARGQCELATDGTPLRFPGVSFDITDRRLLEEALNALNAELEERVEQRTGELIQAQEALRQAQKMEAVGQLTGGIAHDFNNILQGIIGNLMIAKRRIAQGRTMEVEGFISEAVVAANRAAALTHRLLAFARRQPIDPRSIDINDLISTLEDLFRRTIGETIELEVIREPSLWNVLCDPNQLESSLLNLVINARDAMAAGGRLTIETRNLRIEHTAGNFLRQLNCGDYVHIRVDDTGTGMAKDTIEKAFEPFFTTKFSGQGTGLGLAMVYGFTQQSNGHVTIESVLGEGAAINLYLPRHMGTAEYASSLKPSPAPQRAKYGDTILVVEDDPMGRRLIAETLSELGYIVLEASDSAEAEAILRSPERLDLLVTDIGLPGMDGRELANSARRERPGLRVLFITGYAESATSSPNLSGGDMVMLTKPFDMDLFASYVHEMLAAS